MADKQRLKAEHDPYVDPTALKDAEKYDDDLFWDDAPEKGAPEQKAARAARANRLTPKIALIIATFVLALSIGFSVGTRQQPAEQPEQTNITLFDSDANRSTAADLAVPDGQLLRYPSTLGTTQVEIEQGTVTEWIAGSPENDEIPWFRDMAWHSGTGRIYLVGGGSDLYVIDPITNQIDKRDLGLRHSESYASLALVESLDDERLILFNDTSDNDMIIYNVVRDRVETVFGGRSDIGGDGKLYLVADQGLAVAADGTIYMLHTVKIDGEFRDRVEVYSSAGEYQQTIEVERGGDAIAVSPDGTLHTTGYGTINQHDAAGSIIDTNERHNFDYVRDIQFDTAGNYYITRGFDMWFVQVQSDGEIGEVFGPAVDLGSDYWELGEFRRPEALLLLPESNSFVLIDGSYPFQRVVKLDLNRDIVEQGR